MKPKLTCMLAAFLFACSSTPSNDTVTNETPVDTTEERLASDRLIKETPKPRNPNQDRDKLGMKVGAERIFYASDTLKNLRHEFIVRNIGNDSLWYEFSTIAVDGERKSFRGKLKRKEKHYTGVSKRFNTRAPALIYTLDTDTSATELAIDRERCEHVRFDHFVKNLDMIKWKETDPNIIGVKYLTMRVTDPYEDYQAYFKEMIDKVRESYYSYSKTAYSSNDYPRRRNSYLSDFNRLSNLVEEYNKTQSEYVLQDDTTLLNRISVAGLDSIQTMFESNGINFFERVLPSGEQRIPMGFSKTLVVDLINNRKEGLRVEKFYKMQFKDDLSWDNLKFEEGLYKLYSNWRNFIPHDSIYVAVFSSFGFETVSHLITLWEPEGDQLKLKEILDQRLTVGIGEVRLNEIIAISDTETLFIGRKGGGDEGYVWGSFWIGLRSKPNELDIILERKFDGMADIHEYVNYRLLNDSTLELETVLQKWESGKQMDSILSVEVIDLVGLAKGTVTVAEDIKCNRQILEETDNSYNELTPDKIDRFLKTISERCNYNYEKSSYSNGVLMRIFDKYPMEMLKLLTDENTYEFEEILKDLTEPTDPRVHIPGIIEKIEAFDIQNDKTERIKIALRKGAEYIKSQDY